MRAIYDAGMKLAASLFLGAFLGLLCASCDADEGDGPCWERTGEACVHLDTEGERVDERCLDARCCEAWRTYQSCIDGVAETPCPVGPTEWTAIQGETNVICRFAEGTFFDPNACNRACDSL